MMMMMMMIIIIIIIIIVVFTDQIWLHFPSFHMIFVAPHAVLRIFGPGQAPQAVQHGAKPQVAPAQARGGMDMDIVVPKNDRKGLH